MSQAFETEAAAPELRLVAPIDGVLVPLETLPDPVFAQKLMGDGISIDPTGSLVVAPCAGVVTTLHRACHALTLLTDEGVGLLIHVGLDSVALDGKGFKALVEVGDRVEARQPLLELDLDLVACGSTSMLTELIVTEGADGISFKGIRGTVSAGDDEVLRLVVGTPVESIRHGGESEKTEPFEIVNDNGVHARPAARLASHAKRFRSVVTLHKGNASAACTSVTDVMALDLVKGDLVWLSARGGDAKEALVAIQSLLALGLGEDLSKEAPAAERFVSEDELVIGGLPAAPGFAVGKVTLLRHDVPDFPPRTDDPVQDKKKLREALAHARTELEHAEAEFRARGAIEKAEIFAAHAELLGDPALEGEASLRIEGGASAAAAWRSVIDGKVEKLNALASPLIRERIDDLSDVSRRVLGAILGLPPPDQTYSKDTVLVCDDLRPSDVARLESTGVGALVTRHGGPTSHAAIIARSMGVPYVAGIGDAIGRLRAGSQVIVDGDEGSVSIDPDRAALDSASDALLERQLERERELARAHAAALTLDGHVIHVAANIGSAADAERAVAEGGDGVGLLRSEFLFLGRRQAPTEEEQRVEMEKIAKILGPERNLVVRTLDVGGDKPLSYLPLEHEANPFLGIRGIRLSFKYPLELAKQIRAILAAAPHTQLRIMFPMIAKLDEFQRARDAVMEQIIALGARPVELGVMVEVPSAALMAGAFAKEVDFFSIGTNDLTQYTLAMDRGLAELGPHADAMDPAVLRLIRMTTDAAHAEGKPVGVCGGLAADETATPLLLGLGVDELSVPAPAIPELKARIRRLNRFQCIALAKEALGLTGAPAVRQLYERFAKQSLAN